MEETALKYRAQVCQLHLQLSSICSTVVVSLVRFLQILALQERLRNLELGEKPVSSASGSFS